MAIIGCDKTKIRMNSRCALPLLLWQMFVVGCATADSESPPRTLLTKSGIDYSSLWDSNNDGKADIERWYRGSGIVFEKYDLDFDGYWDVQARKHNNGEIEKLYDFPKGKYSVKSHHIFYASPTHSIDVTTLARVNS